MSRRESQRRNSALDDFMRAICLGNYSRSMLVGMFYCAFFDASGERNGFDFLTVAGAVAPHKKWLRFESEWKAVLASEHVTEFHATDFHSGKGEYASWKNDKPRRGKFLQKLGQIAQKNTNKLICCSVELAAWEQVNTEFYLEEFFYTPYSLAGVAVVESALRWGMKKKNARLSVFFEGGDDGWGGLQKLCAKYQVIPQQASRHIVPCQLADMLAWKTRIAATNSLKLINKMRAPIENSEIDLIEADVLEQLKSLNTVMVRPVKNGIFSIDNLRTTCRQSGVPKRTDRPIKFA